MVEDSYINDTRIIIDIQADNKLEILTCIRETFEFMPGWSLDSSVLCSPDDARIFAFQLNLHTFEWWRGNDTFSDTMDEDEVVIKDLADISHLLEFVWVNCEKLREKEDVNAKLNKLFEHFPLFIGKEKYEKQYLSKMKSSLDAAFEKYLYEAL